MRFRQDQQSLCNTNRQRDTENDLFTYKKTPRNFASQDIDEHMRPAENAFAAFQLSAQAVVALDLPPAGPHPMSSLAFRVLIRMSSQWGFALHDRF